MTQHTLYTVEQINNFIKDLKNNPDLCQYLLFHYGIKAKNKGVKK
jgi:hypothetical protein